MEQCITKIPYAVVLIMLYTLITLVTQLLGSDVTGQHLAGMVGIAMVIAYVVSNTLIVCLTEVTEL